VVVKKIRNLGRGEWFTMEVEKGLASSAVEKFLAGYACSQAILAAFAPELDLDESMACKLGAGFGGGFGRLGFTCGAVSGAVAVLGLALSNGVGSDGSNRERVYMAVQEFCRRFAVRCGGLDCRSLIGREIATPEAFAAARQTNVFRTICPNFVRTAAEILEELLREKARS